MEAERLRAKKAQQEELVWAGTWNAVFSRE